MNPIDLVVDVVAGYRLTRLVTADTITEPIRWRLVTDSFTRAGLEIVDTEDTALGIVDAAREFGLPERDLPKVAALITCRWCAGMWVAFGVVAARRLAPDVWDPIARALVVSAGAALIAGLEQ